MLDKKILLCSRFHSFCNHFHTEVMPHGDNSLHNNGSIAIFGDVVNKAPVNFKLIKR